jgi:hypothetical protein
MKCDLCIIGITRHHYYKSLSYNIVKILYFDPRYFSYRANVRGYVVISRLSAYYILLEVLHASAKVLTRDSM